MDDSACGLPALREETGRRRGRRLPAGEQAVQGPMPEDLLLDYNDLGKETLLCFGFEEALVSEVMMELEETIKGPTRSAPTTTRLEDISGPLVSVAGSSVMASVDVGRAGTLICGRHWPALYLRQRRELGASFVHLVAVVCSDESSGGGGHGGAATSKLEEEEEEGKEENEWLTRVLSGPLLELERGFLGF